MYFTQVGQIGTPVIVAKKAQLPTANAANVGRYYITTYDPEDSSDYPKGTVLTIKQDGDTFSLVAVFQMPAMTNPIESAADIVKDKQAVNNKGKLVTGTFTTVEKTIDANGTFYPADDNANAYSKVTVNVAGETAENPYIATTDSEMAAYLAAEYADSFVRMDYAKYRVTLPATATYDQAKFNYESIGIPRMCEYIDKWLSGDSSKNVLTLTITGGSSSAELTAYIRTTAYKFSNADGTYGYALAIKYSYVNDAGNETVGSVTPAFLYHIKSGTVIDSWTANNDYNEGWTYFGGDTGESTMDNLNDVIQLLYQNRTGSYTVAVSDALILTNMAGSEVDNKYVEGGIYKVVTNYKEVYQPGDPFQVGDAFAGATVCINQNLTYDTFAELAAQALGSGDYELPYVFFNGDNPLENDESSYPYIMGLCILPVEDEYWLISYSLLDTEAGEFIPILTPETRTPAVTSFTIPESMTLNGRTITTPATITKINNADILNQIATKAGSVGYTAVYDVELQNANGVYEEAQTEAKLDAKIVNDNIGKIYQYTGTTGNKYKNQSLYIIMED